MGSECRAVARSHKSRDIQSKIHDQEGTSQEHPRTPILSRRRGGRSSRSGNYDPPRNGSSGSMRVVVPSEHESPRSPESACEEGHLQNRRCPHPQLKRSVVASYHDRGLAFFGGSSFNDGTTQTARDPLLKGGRLAPLKSVYFGSNEGRGPVPSVQP